MIDPGRSDVSADELLAEIDALGRRAYPEIGVPAFLIAEDLTSGDATLEHSEPDDLAATLERLAAIMATRRSILDAATIAQLMELLADRHFLPLSATPFSHMTALHPAPAR